MNDGPYVVQEVVGADGRLRYRLSRRGPDGDELLGEFDSLTRAKASVAVWWRAEVPEGLSAWGFGEDAELSEREWTSET